MLPLGTQFALIEYRKHWGCRKNWNFLKPWVFRLYWCSSKLLTHTVYFEWHLQTARANSNVWRPPCCVPESGDTHGILHGLHPIWSLFSSCPSKGERHQAPSRSLPLCMGFEDWHAAKSQRWVANCFFSVTLRIWKSSMCARYLLLRMPFLVEIGFPTRRRAIRAYTECFNRAWGTPMDFRDRKVGAESRTSATWAPEVLSSGSRCATFWAFSSPQSFCPFLVYLVRK